MSYTNKFLSLSYILIALIFSNTSQAAVPCDEASKPEVSVCVDLVCNSSNGQWEARINPAYNGIKCAVPNLAECTQYVCRQTSCVPEPMPADECTFPDSDISCPEIVNINLSTKEDNDDDFIADACDNCVNVENNDQDDTDGDGIGTSCDNCPFLYNPDQLDDNQNYLGNACDGPTGPPNTEIDCNIATKPEAGACATVICNKDSGEWLLEAQPDAEGDACGIRNIAECHQAVCRGTACVNEPLDISECVFPDSERTEVPQDPDTEAGTEEDNDDDSCDEPEDTSSDPEINSPIDPIPAEAPVDEPLTEDQCTQQGGDFQKTSVIVTVQDVLKARDGLLIDDTGAPYVVEYLPDGNLSIIGTCRNLTGGYAMTGGSCSLQNSSLVENNSKFYAALLITGIMYTLILWIIHKRGV